MTTPHAILLDIDRLIDFYEHHAERGAGMRIPVNANRWQLGKAIGYPLPNDPPPKDYEPPKEYNYRGRILIAIIE